MTYIEALEQVRNLNDHDDLLARVVRILPEDIDPIKFHDNGWDVEVKTTGEIL